MRLVSEKSRVYVPLLAVTGFWLGMRQIKDQKGMYDGALRILRSAHAVIYIKNVDDRRIVPLST